MASGPPLLTPDWTPDEIREECLFTESALLADPLTKPLGAPFTALIESCDAVIKQRRTICDNIVRAYARNIALDRNLDALVDKVDIETRNVTGGSRTDPLYQMLFPRTPNTIRRPVLGSELVAVEPWPSHLTACGHPSLQALAAPVSKAIQDARAGEASVATLENQLVEFDTTGAKKELIANANSLRSKTFGALGELAHSQPGLHLGNDFAASFFRRSQRRARGPVTISQLDSTIAAVQRQLGELVEERNQIAKHAEVDSAARAAAERKAAQAELAQLRSQIDELNRRAVDLQNKAGT